MAEVRRRKGDGDNIENDLSGGSAAGGGGSAAGGGESGATPSNLASGSNAEKQALLEPLQLSDSATADSSDHVREWEKRLVDGVGY